VLVPGRPQAEYILFVRDRDPARETWDGKRAGPDGAVRDYGADDAFPIGDIDDILPGLIENCGRVYYTMGLNADFDHRVIGWVNSLRGQSRLGIHYAAGVRCPRSPAARHAAVQGPDRAHRDASRRADRGRAHLRAMRAARPGVFEYQLMAEILHEFHRHNADISYHPIVGGGANACTLHYHANSAVLEDGDLLLIDAVASISTTPPTSPEPSPSTAASARSSAPCTRSC
jgi:Xaa-Pro aminopeptidase